MDPRRHRHFVALPLALGALLLVLGTHAILAGSLKMGTDTVAMVTKDTEKTIDIGSLLTVHLQPQTVARADRAGTSVTLKEGEVTVRSHGYVKVDLGQGVSAHVLGGAASFLAGATSTTIVALSSPIVVETKGRTLLAAGHQLIVTPSSVTRSVVPAEWTLARLEFVSSKNSIADSTEDPNQQLAALLRADTPTSIEDIALLQTTLIQVSGRFDLASLMALSLLASGRPIAKNVVPELGKTLQASAELRSGIPLALVQIARVYGKPLPEPLVTLWSEELVRTASTDIELALESLAFGADAAVRFRTLGYPISADEWQTAVMHTSTVLRSIARSEEEKQRIARTEDRMNSIKLSPLLASLEPAKKEEDTTQSSVPTLSSEVLISLASKMLFDRGALLTGDTTLAIDPRDPARVLIHDFFHEEYGDLVSYDASYDPVTDMLWLTREDERLSNPVTSTQFFQ